jgi:hypothetical protein
MMGTRCHEPQESRRRMSKSIWNEPELMKPNKPKETTTADALAHNTLVQTAHRHGLAACTTKSNAARGRLPSSPEPAKILLQQP